MDVILVSWDDVGYRDITSELCPRLSGLRSEGVDYTRAFSTPVCSQSRALVLYGALGRTLGILGSMGAQDPSQAIPPASWPTLPGKLKAAGYSTCLVGKWHSGHAPSGGDWRLAPLERGYDCWLAGTPSNLDPGYRDWQRIDATPSGVSDFQETGYATLKQLEAATSWWNTTPPQRFLHLSLNEAHGPFDLPPQELLGGLEVTGGSPQREKYEAKIRAGDTALGRILDLPGADDALIAFFSDNGTPQTVPGPGQSPSKVKTTTFDGGIHVPMCIRVVDVPPLIDSRLVSLVDLPAVILYSLGIEIPPEWDGQLAPARNHVISEAEMLLMGDTVFDQCARSGTHKLRNREGVEELYNLVIDPTESYPLSLTAPENAIQLTFLRSKLYG